MNTNFQRSQSKVWFGSATTQNDIYSLAEQKYFLKSQLQQSAIPEDDHTVSITDNNNSSAWDYRRDSPGSLKSHDSGFSDSENFQTKILNQQASSPTNYRNTKKIVNLDKLTPKKNVNHEINTFLNSRSPSISSEQSTPPTVIRKKLTTDYLCTARRISFSAPSSPINERSLDDASDLNFKIDSLNYDSTSPMKITPPKSNEITKTPLRSSLKRGSRLSSSERKVTRNLLSCFSPFSANKSKDGSFKSYNNETVVFGCGDEDNNNNVTNVPSTKVDILPTYSSLYPTETSTPKKSNQQITSTLQQSSILSDSIEMLDLTATMNWNTCTYIDYTNPALNGHATSVQFWLDEIRSSYCHEVLSTLQTKSVAQEAAKNVKVNSATAGKVIRHIQSKAMQLQQQFDKVEKLLISTDLIDGWSKVPSLIIGLFEDVMQFINKLKYRNIFRSENGLDLKRFEAAINQIIDMSIDLHKTVSSADPKNFESKILLFDIQRLKQSIGDVTRKIFEKLIRIVIDRIEDTQCDMIIRSNLTMLSMLSNMDYNGIASLDDAFFKTNTVKVLLGICMGSKYSSVRTLALRALATICSNRELIKQFEENEGIDILKDILTNDRSGKYEPELREAVSVLTQITAPWHEIMRCLNGLKENLESLIECITNLLEKTFCCQTLLLCTACLNNIAQMESTAVYSIMSNETIFKIKIATIQRGPDASIFLYVS